MLEVAVSMLIEGTNRTIMRTGREAMTRQVALGSVAAILGLIHGQSAYAQTPAGSADPQESSAAQSGGFGTEEIVVTAQRRSESLERTPVAVSVIGSEALKEKSITSQADLQSAVPGLQVKASQSSDQLNYAIRGQSLDPFSSVRPGVLPYFNEVQVGGPGSGAFYDLQSVQVLKGPQGTLFGRNSTGGAVLVTSTKPENRFGGYISGRLGNYDLRQIEGAINVPIVDDKVLLRVSGLIERRDGFQLNLFDGERVGDIERDAVRGSLTLNPTPALSNTLVVDYLHSGGSSTSNVLYSVFQPGQQGPGATIAPVPANVLFSPLLDSVFGPGSFAAYLAAHPGADPDGIIAFAEKQKQRGPFKINVDGANSHSAKNLVVSNITTLDIGTDTQIKNVFGYTRIKTLDRAEFDGSPYGIDTLGPQGLRQDLRQVSEELQLIGKTGSLSYVTGIYYSNEKLDYFSESIIFDVGPFIPLSDQFNHSITTNKTLAPYAQGTYDLSGLTGVSGLSVTAGVRYTVEKVRIARQPDDIYIANPQPGFVLDPQSQKFKKWSWQFGVQEQLDNVLLYAVTRRSFRSGGFNSIAPPLPGLGNEGGSEYLAEVATDVELGAKFRGNVAGAPVRLNVAGYNLWVEDIQRVTYALIRGTPSAITVNVPKARVTGIEADLTVSPTSWLNIGGSVNYAKGRFTSNLVRVAGGDPVAFGPYPDLPEFSATAFAQITVPVKGTMTVSARGDIYGQTKTYFSSAQRALNPGAVLPGYSLTDFRLALQDEQAGWSLSANLKNAFNRVYYVGGLPFESVFALNAAVPGAPRTFLVQAEFRF
jgi:iron complex outermembrane recepter protein